MPARPVRRGCGHGHSKPDVRALRDTYTEWCTQLGAGPDDPAVRHIRDAYLEVWSDLAPPRELVAELELACWVGKVARTLTWARALRAQGHDQAREFADAPRQHLTALLADSWSDLARDD